MARKLPEILKTETVAKSQVFEVQSVQLRFDNGEERTYERLTPRRKPAVMILPIDGEDLILVKEYAVGSERYELGFPKGGMDALEIPIQSAQRELQEEIGFGAHTLIPLRALYSSPSHMYNLLYVVVAQDLYPSKLEGDEPEPLEIVRYPLRDIDKLLNDPSFCESRNLAALFLLRDYLREEAANAEWM